METTESNQALYRLNQAVLALTLVVMFLLALTPGISMSEDLGRHLLLGKMILKQGAIPTTNLLTYTCPDFPFVNHHWLSEVLLYMIHRGVGLNGLIFFKAILLTLALAIPLGMRPVRAVSALYLFAGALCAVLLAYRAHIRPEIFTFIGVAFYGWMLERISCAHPGKRYLGWALLILYGMVWANAHIYFIFGIGMVGAYVFSCWLFFLVRRPSELSAAPWRELLLLGILCLVSCVNPNGVYGLIYPLTIFSNYGIGITENSSPLELWRSVLNPMLLALPPLSLIALYAILRQACCPRTLTPVRLARILITLVALIATWCMARSAPLLALTLLPTLSDALDRSSRGAQPIDERTVGWNKKWASLRIAAVVGVLIFNGFLVRAILNGSYYRIFPSPIGPTPFGLDEEGRYLALRRLKEQGLNGPVFNDYNIGSLVEYNLYPIPAYTDNRPEAFPVSFWQDEYLPALSDITRWKQLLAARNIQTIIVSIAGVKAPFVRMMMYDTEWQLIHLDFLCAVWVRKSAENSDILSNATYTYDDLNAFCDRIAQRIRTLDAQPFWKRQVLADQIAYELYALICIDQQALAWPLLLQMHLRYPDYQILHELMLACAPPDAQPALFDILRHAARYPLSAKQSLDYSDACRQRGLHEDAARAVRRGLFFFPLNPHLRALKQTD